MFFTLVVLMVMSIVGLALASNSTAAVRLTRIQQNGSIAFNLAESGAERGLLWLRQQASPPASLTPFNPFGGPVTLGDGTYTVAVDGDDNNPNLQLKRYSIKCVGQALGRQETVEMYVQATTFGRYAYFTDYEVSSITNGAIFFKAGEVVDGPAHSNNTSGSVFNINYVNSTTAIFKDMLTGVETSILWKPYDPANEADYMKVFLDGSRGFRLGVNRIELPDSTDRQKNAAWGATTGFPSTSGVFLNSASSALTGGLYINGDSTVEFVDGGNAKQIIQIVQGGVNYKITVDRVNNTTTLRKGDSDWTDSNGGGVVTSYTGVPNGVIYSTGNITSFKGTLSDSQMSGSAMVSRNAWTVATDMLNAKSVTVTNNVTYATQPDKTKAWDDPVNLKSAALGVVARNIILDANAPTNLTLQGVMLSGGRNTTDGSFYNAAWSTKTPGMLNLTGGIIQKKRGPVGTFDPNTGNQVSGYQKNYSYDRRMAVNPPPFFPTTGTYERLSWTRTVAGSY
jgi:Tfp pilus assembly protein PilX